MVSLLLLFSSIVVSQTVNDPSLRTFDGGFPFVSLDFFWLKDDSLDNRPPPDVLAQEIVEQLGSALASFLEVAAGMPRKGPCD